MCYSFLIYFEMPSSFAVYIILDVQEEKKMFGRRGGCNASTCTKREENVTYMHEIISEGTKTTRE